jgi:hypothetical protein
MGTKIEELRAYEAKTLRVRWDFISQAAATKASVLNWDSAPASAWNRMDSSSYALMVQQWAIHVSPALEEIDPTGSSTDPAIVSLRRGLYFHLERFQHLSKIGILASDVPSATAAGIKAGIAGLFTTVLPKIGNAAMDAAATAKKAVDAGVKAADNLAGSASMIVIVLIVVAGVVAFSFLKGKK